MTTDTDLRAKAEAATPVHDGNLMRYEHGGGRLAIIPVPGDGQRKLIADFYDEANREFYAGARATVLSLLDRLEATRRLLDDAVKALEFYGSEWQFTINKRYGGLEWKPKESLLDDCGNTARATLTSIRAKQEKMG